MGLYPEGKVPDSPPSSSPSSALQAGSSPSLQQTIPGYAPFPFALSPQPSFSCLDSVVRMKQSATQFLLSAFETCGLRKLSSPFPFSHSLCSQATTELKWFAAAKKISLFSSHSRSLAAPPPHLTLALSLAGCLPRYSRCLCLNSAPFVLFPALVLKHRKCSNHAGFLSLKEKKKKKPHMRQRQRERERKREREVLGS